tara:strand:+ start:416 stop:775 length:360 start_codon:yes stop_codon:yes gene_type:complete
MSFQTIVVTIAIITLIVLLTWIGYGMYKNETNAKFPPVSSDCPDYWTTKGTGDKLECVNVKHLGNCFNTKGKDSINFNTPFFKGSHGFCRKADWARRCGVSWNGITNAGSRLQKKCGQQ